MVDFAVRRTSFSKRRTISCTSIMHLDLGHFSAFSYPHPYSTIISCLEYRDSYLTGNPFSTFVPLQSILHTTARLLLLLYLKLPNNLPIDLKSKAKNFSCKALPYQAPSYLIHIGTWIWKMTSLLTVDRLIFSLSKHAASVSYWCVINCSQTQHKMINIYFHFLGLQVEWISWFSLSFG